MSRSQFHGLPPQHLRYNRRGEHRTFVNLLFDLDAGKSNERLLAPVWLRPLKARDQGCSMVNVTVKSTSIVRVAIAQAAPVYHNKAASLAKALELIQRAASQGATLIAFGETWIPGYSVWLDICPNAALWNHEPTKEVFAELRENSIAIDGPEVAQMSKIARELQIGIVIGINERVEQGPGSKTLYNSLLTFSPDGRLANHHPKLVPTFTERLVWGNGDGRGLKSVDVGQVRVGGLICWEHWMPLARMAMHQAGRGWSLFPSRRLPLLTFGDQPVGVTNGLMFRGIFSKGVHITTLRNSASVSDFDLKGDP